MRAIETAHLQPAVGKHPEAAKGGADALFQDFGAPFPAAFLRLMRGEEHCRPRPGQLAVGAREAVPVGHADTAVVAQLIAVVMVNGAVDRCVSGHVHQYASAVSAQGADVLVDRHLIVAAQRCAESTIGGRGQPDAAQRAPFAQRKGQGDSGFARSAGDQAVARGVEVLCIELVFAQPGGEEQAAQQRILLFARRLVERVRRGALKLRVHRSESLAVRRDIRKAVAMDFVGLNQQVGAHRKKTPHALADADLRVRAGRNARVAHGGNPPPGRIGGGKETPVAQRIPHLRVGDVVGGKCKAIHRQQYLPGLQGVGQGVFGDTQLADVLAQHLQCSARRRRHARLRARRGSSRPR